MSISYCIYPTLLDNFYYYKCYGGKKFQELIDKINRVKTPLADAAQRGISFEDCVNKTLRGEPTYLNFKPELIDKIANKLSNAIKQQEYVEGVFDTVHGQVKMYGMIDYSYPEMYVDLKTTQTYRSNKFKINSQHKAYPYLNQLNGGTVKQFNYLITDFYNMYTEPYQHTQAMVNELIKDTTEFIEFLEANRHLITDKKIFNQA